MIRPETFARYAAMRVPRYTSYPAAPHFTPAVDETDYRRWLRRIPDGESTSIYIHIPFCSEMCWYCGCHTSVTKRQAPISRYVATLLAEIALVTAELQGKLRIVHLHWGGGSPTLLPPEAIGRLAEELRGSFDFAAEAEMAVEVDPRTLTEAVTAAFARTGLNRASVGVQSFDPVVQAAINRIQSFEVTARAVDLLRGKGIGAINFDLIYGLPHQTIASCIETVEQALTLHPSRFAVFGYAHVPGLKPHQRKIDEEALPGPAERHEQFQAIADVLASSGYEQVGLDHFALPDDSLALAAAAGTLRRNFQGYTTDRCRTLFGFGASAIGQLREGFVQNAARIPEYQRRIEKGSLPIVRGYKLTDDDRRRAAIIDQLMCNYEAEADELPDAIEPLEADGLVRRRGNRIEVTPDAKPLVRTVAAAFDAYLTNSLGTHAPAV
jgi:oxygen-independent coproporphyrinogen III oxidase